jgi:hypothetical protein
MFYWDGCIDFCNRSRKRDLLPDYFEIELFYKRYGMHAGIRDTYCVSEF